MRSVFPLLMMLCLAACQRGGQNNTDAVRQGVIDHLAKINLNVSGMDVKVTSVQFKGDQADATVDITPKGASNAPPMTFGYHLQQQNNKWVVQGPASATGHGGTVDSNAGATNPHGGAMPPAAPGGDSPHGAMPSPQDLPPASKK